MEEFFEKIFTLTYWDVMTDLHGALSMLSLILFGLAIAWLISLDKFAKATTWLKYTMVALFTTVALLDFMGLFIYRPYRTQAVPSPRTFLKSSTDTSWLHTIIFEQKEHLAFVPLIVLLAAMMVVLTQGSALKTKSHLRRLVWFAVIASLVMVLVVAAEAVLVTKAAPLR